MSYAVVVATVVEAPAAAPVEGAGGVAVAARSQQVRDTVTGEVTAWGIYDRAAMALGATLAGPAIIAEDETSTLVGPGWTARINSLGYIELLRGAAA